MELREFGQTDWYGLSGCEPWADGHNPMVAYGVPVEYWPRKVHDTGVTVVVDYSGVAVMGEDDDYLSLDQDDRDTAVDIAELILSKPIDYRVLIALGFKAV